MRVGREGEPSRCAHCVTGVAAGGGYLLDVLLSERYLREKQHPGRMLRRSEAVVGALRRHVGEVDTLAEHVAGGGRLGRGDAQAAAEDARPIREAGPMEEELPVADVPTRGGGGGVNDDVAYTWTISRLALATAAATALPTAPAATVPRCSRQPQRHLNASASPSRATSNACSSCRLYDECVAPCVLRRYSCSSWCMLEFRSIGVSCVRNSA